MRRHHPETGWLPVRANGIDFAFLTWGEGPLLLLLHGFPDTAHTWDDLGPRFAREGWRVVAPFLRGYAPSGRPTRDDYGAETLGRDVAALIEALGADSAVVAGHDWGAMAAWSAASLAPERVARLVAVAIPHPSSLRPTPSNLWGVRHFAVLRLPGAAARFARDDFAGIRELYERWSPAHVWPDTEFEAAKNAFAAPGGLAAALGYYRCAGLPPPALRRPVQVPTLVVGGTHDGVASAVDFEGSRAWVAAPTEVVMVPGGHFLHREHPDAFFEAVRGFLGAPASAAPPGASAVGGALSPPGPPARTAPRSPGSTRATR
jgi:pimeloyl-ACP methyl ester carboxylesterase